MNSFKDRFPLLSYWAGKKLMILDTLFYRNNPIKWTLKKYKKMYGIKLNLNKPVSYYEKMNYWKHFSYDPTQDVLTDKLSMKDFLREKGYSDLVVQTYFKTNSAKQFKKWFYNNKDVLKRFVVKTNHGCGDVFIFDNGVFTKKNGRIIKSVNSIVKILSISLKTNHYYSRFEQNYKNITPMIYIEEFIDLSDGETKEYEFMTNYGDIKYSNIIFERQSPNRKVVIVDSNFKFLEMYYGAADKATLNKIREPKNLAFIKKFIKDNCASFPFCRVDFIETKNKLLLNEFTFVKSGGIDIYKPDYLNNKLGELFKL